MKITKVYLIELLYDFIYVCAISRLTILYAALLRTTPSLTNVLTWTLLVLFLLLSWFQLSVYANRFPLETLTAYGLTGTIILLLIIMTMTMSSSWVKMALPYQAMMMLMIFVLMMLYLFEGTKNVRARSFIRFRLLSLAIILISCLIGCLTALLKWSVATLVIDLLGFAAAHIVMFYFTGKRRYIPVNTTHLLQQFEGMMVLMIAGLLSILVVYFKGINLYLPILLAIIVLLGVCYLLQADFMLEPKKVQLPRLIVTHALMAFSLLAFYVGLYLKAFEAHSSIEVRIIMYVAMGVFFLSLMSLASYDYPKYRLAMPIIQRMGAGYIFGGLVIFISPVTLFILLGLLWITTSFFYLLLDVYDYEDY